MQTRYIRRGNRRYHYLLFPQRVERMKDSQLHLAATRIMDYYPFIVANMLNGVENISDTDTMIAATAKTQNVLAAFNALRESLANLADSVDGENNGSA